VIGRQRGGNVGLALVAWSYLAACASIRTWSNGAPRLCPWFLLTGFDCPLCGTTRAWGALLHGDTYAAFQFNHWTPLLLPLWVAFAVVVTIRSIAPSSEGALSISRARRSMTFTKVDSISGVALTLPKAVAQ
jgi:hypothetical protein